ncbi:MAG: Lrp/AsnC family transcriptional regulator [Pseudomonadota bacterium]
MSLDRFDAAIITTLLKNSRATGLELSKEVGLSPSACARRIQQLETDGYITGSQATIDLDRIGFRVTVIVTLTLAQQTEEAMEEFERAVAKFPSVLWCFLMSGTGDYIMSIAARDVRDYERIHKEQLSCLPGVSKLHSSFALREVVRRPAPAHLKTIIGSVTRDV